MKCSVRSEEFVMLHDESKLRFRANSAAFLRLEATDPTGFVTTVVPLASLTSVPDSKPAAVAGLLVTSVPRKISGPDGI